MTLYLHAPFRLNCVYQYSDRTINLMTCQDDQIDINEKSPKQDNGSAEEDDTPLNSTMSIYRIYHI